MKLVAVNIGQTFIGNNTTGSGVKFMSIDSIPAMVTLILRASFVFAGLILLFYFIMGGIGMIGSAGKNNPQAAEQAKKSITGAVTGFVVVFVAYWIVKLIGEILGINDLI
jgi:hypothetical protein